MTTRRVLKTSLLPTIRETSRTEQYLKVQNEALELFKKKNNDYGDAFATYGTVGIIVRLGDKISRLSSVTRNGINLVDSESLRDTLIDIHNYAAMGIILIDEIPKKLNLKIQKTPPPSPRRKR